MGGTHPCSLHLVKKGVFISYPLDSEWLSAKGAVSPGALQAGCLSVPAVGSLFCSLEFEMGTSVVWEMSGFS